MSLSYDSQPHLNLSGTEFLLKTCMRTNAASDLLQQHGVHLSSKEIRESLKSKGFLEAPDNEGLGLFVLKFAATKKQRCRYRCDVFFRPISFVA